MANQIYIYAGTSAGFRLKTEVHEAFLYLRSIIAKEPPVYEYDLDDYASQLIALLPRGPAWDCVGDDLFGQLIYAIATEFTRASDKMVELENETFPLNATQLLPEWERVMDLPDSSMAGIPQSTAERRAAVATKLSTLTEPTTDFFASLAASFGYAVEVIEYFPARVGRARVGDRINASGNEFLWSVKIPGDYTQSRRAIVGDSFIGDRIATWGQGSLEALISQYKPAHTSLNFLYD